MPKDQPDNPRESDDPRLVPLITSPGDRGGGGGGGNPRRPENDGSSGDEQGPPIQLQPVPAPVPVDRGTNRIRHQALQWNELRIPNLDKVLNQASNAMRSTFAPFASRVKTKISDFEQWSRQKGFDLKKMSQWTTCATHCLGGSAMTTPDRIHGKFNSIRLLPLSQYISFI